MIEIRQVSKSFEAIEAIKEISLTIQSRNVFGMLGTNGAGKSTLLRMTAGVLKPDEGEIFIDGKKVWDNPEAKALCFYISDEQFFFPNATAKDMATFYGRYYTKFDYPRFEELLNKFGLDGDRKIQTYSKGMKKQVSVICGVCAGTDYLFCDETFDGLDPVMRQTVKSIFVGDMEERNLTPIIASHNLRELEDICDHVGLLHKGGILLSRDLEDMKLNIHKLQCVLLPGTEPEDIKGLDIIKIERRGSLCTLTIRGNREDIEAGINVYRPVFAEIIPLTLEEIFISETEVAGYDIKKLVL